jgi:hypothetical protein
MSTGTVPAKIAEWFGPSWRTKLAGLVTIVLSLVLLFADDLGISPEMAVKLVSAVSIVTGGGLIVARDNKVSSEQAGAKQ